MPSDKEILAEEVWKIAIKNNPERDKSVTKKQLFESIVNFKEQKYRDVGYRDLIEASLNALQEARQEERERIKRAVRARYVQKKEERKQGKSRPLYEAGRLAGLMDCKFIIENWHEEHGILQHTKTKNVPVITAVFPCTTEGLKQVREYEAKLTPKKETKKK